MTDEEFAIEFAYLYELAEKAVPLGVAPPRFEAQVANCVDVPSVGVQFPDRCANILADWPAKII